MRGNTVRATTRFTQRPVVSRAVHAGPLRANQSSTPTHNGGAVPTTPSGYNPTPLDTGDVRGGRKAEGIAAQGSEVKEDVDWETLGLGAAIGAGAFLL